MIAALRKGFVNTWLLAKDLDEIAARSGDADIAKLCNLIKDNYAYPVDSVLIASDLRVVGHVNVHEPRASDPDAYLGFLREGLVAAHGEAKAAEVVVAQSRKARGAGGVPAVKLTPDSPTGSVLDVIRRRGLGKPSMAFFPIDATAFADGGTLEVTVRVGGAEAACKFELCAAVAGGMAPVRTLEKVGRSATDSMTHEFAKGALFGLAVMPGPGSVEGDVNAFLATVTVRAR